MPESHARAAAQEGEQEERGRADQVVAARPPAAHEPRVFSVDDNDISLQITFMIIL